MTTTPPIPADRRGALARVRLDGPVDWSRPFICPTLLPLGGTAAFADLSDAQRLYYNQLVGLMHNEVIALFEQQFAARALPAVLADSTLPAELAAALRGFLEDEHEHTAKFHALNRLAAPDWYAGGEFHILRLPAAFGRTVGFFANRPLTFPFIFWVMLLMEERSLLIGRRYERLDDVAIEPHFAAVYRAHLRDEAHHVQLDRRLLDRFYDGRPAWLRRINARLLEALVVGLFLKPRRANVRLVNLLIDRFPDLASRRGELVGATRGLDADPAYRRTMYSAEATPIAGAMFERMPELRRLRNRLFAPEAA